MHLVQRRFPFPPNPVGWFAVAYSDELPRSGVVPLKYFGEDLVLFRTEDGRAVVLDAFCPHLGAHLGEGGVVEGGRIRCPFHAWCFDAVGVCREVPYSQKLPRASLRAWPVCERNGFILVYHHPARREPEWEIPLLPEYGASEWTPYYQRRWKIRTDIHEMVENAFDAAHFQHLHKLRKLPELDLHFDGPLFQLRARTEMETPFGVIDGMLDIRSVGFGFGTVRFTGLIETLLITTITPIDDEHVDARFTFTVKKLPDESATRTVGDGFIEELARQVHQDIRIWEAKTYLQRPILCREDAPIAAFRNWAVQFYP